MSRSQRNVILLVSVVLVIAGEAYGYLGAGATSAPASYSTRYTVTQGLCGGRTVAAALADVHTGSLTVGVSVGVGSYRIYLTIDSLGQPCDPYGNYVAVRHENVTLSVRDLTSPFNGTELWIGGLDVSVGPLASAFGATWSAPTRATALASQLGPGNAQLLGTVDVEWNPQVDGHLNVTCEETVFADPGLAHVGATMLFVATARFAVDNSACFGRCWSPFFDEGFTANLTYQVVVSSC